MSKKTEGWWREWGWREGFDDGRMTHTDNGGIRWRWHEERKENKRRGKPCWHEQKKNKQTKEKSETAFNINQEFQVVCLLNLATWWRLWPWVCGLRWYHLKPWWKKKKYHICVYLKKKGVASSSSSFSSLQKVLRLLCFLLPSPSRFSIVSKEVARKWVLNFQSALGGKTKKKGNKKKAGRKQKTHLLHYFCQLACLLATPPTKIKNIPPEGAVATVKHSSREAGKLTSTKWWRKDGNLTGYWSLR